MTKQSREELQEFEEFLKELELSREEGEEVYFLLESLVNKIIHDVINKEDK